MLIYSILNMNITRICKTQLLLMLLANHPESYLEVKVHTTDCC